MLESWALVTIPLHWQNTWDNHLRKTKGLLNLTVLEVSAWPTAPSLWACDKAIHHDGEGGGGRANCSPHGWDSKSRGGRGGGSIIFSKGKPHTPPAMT
jgi:hypothetical protein